MCGRMSARTRAHGTVRGGVPLGLAIADEIYAHGLARTPLAEQPLAIHQPWKETKTAGGMASPVIATAVPGSLAGVEARALASGVGKVSDTSIR